MEDGLDKKVTLTIEYYREGLKITVNIVSLRSQKGWRWASVGSGQVN